MRSIFARSATIYSFCLSIKRETHNTDHMSRTHSCTVSSTSLADHYHTLHQRGCGRTKISFNLAQYKLDSVAEWRKELNLMRLPSRELQNVRGGSWAERTEAVKYP